jgi:hypothetical protein
MAGLVFQSLFQIREKHKNLSANPICSFFLTALAIITALLLAIPDYENKKTPDMFISDALFLIRK